jgi:hypothetical protein
MYSKITIKVILIDKGTYLWKDEPTKEELRTEIMDISYNFLPNIEVKYRNKKIIIHIYDDDNKIDDIINFCKKYNEYKSLKTRFYFYGISLKIEHF